MKERKYVKLRSDMYSDTKFKIIDTKPERDMIHYAWTRLLTLAAKVNLRGDLYMSRNLPYAIETLAIELNRSEEQIKMAIEVFLELEMLELIDGRIYRVKNFAKHQNIKVEEEVNSEDKEVNVKNIEAATKAVIANENCDREEKKSEKEEDSDKDFENNLVRNEESPTINDDKRALEINSSEFNKENNMNREINDNIPQNNIPISFTQKKNKKSSTKKKKEEVINVTDEEEGEDEELFSIRDGEFVLGEGEKIIASWTF